MTYSTRSGQSFIEEVSRPFGLRKKKRSTAVEGQDA